MRSPTTSGSTTTACTPCVPMAGRAASRGPSTNTRTSAGTGTATARYPAWRTPPERPALAWAAAAVGPWARVRSVRPLGGGIAEATDSLTIDDATGVRHRLVLQRWIRPGWETDDPGFNPAKEAAVLAALGPTVIPAPRLVAVDPDGSQAGVPALLTERLPGRQPTVREIARPETLTTLGSMLAEIHRVGAGLAGDPALRAIGPPYYA